MGDFMTPRPRRRDQSLAGAVGGFLTNPQAEPDPTLASTGGDPRLTGGFEFGEEPEAAPPRGGIAAVAAPQDPKAAEREALRVNMTAAAGRSISGTGEAQQKLTKPPAPPATSTMPKVGTGPPLASSGTPAPSPGEDPHYAKTVPMKMQDGRTIFSSPDRAAELAKAGGMGMDRAEAIARSGNREDKTSQAQGAQIATGASGAAFLRPSQKVQLPSPPDSRPYSAQVDSLPGTMPKIDLSKPGNDWKFSGGREEGGGAPREGTRSLSGLEQASSRRAWLEHRADEERATELVQAQQGKELKEANLDPLELARINAQAKYGGDVAKVKLDVESRRSALDDYTRVHDKIEAARDMMAKLPPGSPQAAMLKEYIDALEREGLERANIIAGQRLMYPRPNILEELGGLGTGAPAAVPPPTGAR